MIDTDSKQAQRLAAAKLASIIRRRKALGKRVPPEVANELEYHRSVIESAPAQDQVLIENWNLSLYWAQQADAAGKDIEVIRKHLQDANKARLKLTSFDVEKNKVALAKENMLRKKYGISAK